MDKITFATTNEAKLNQIRGALLPIGVEVVGIAGREVPEVIEDGKTIQKNAYKKATAYAAELGEPVLSMDNALYLDALTDADQPGAYVRRINGRTDRPTDAELLAYYTDLIRSFGKETTTGRWEFAVCFATPDGGTSETTIISPRIFTSVVSENLVDGYPLESIQVDPVTGKCIADMTQDEQDAFWQQAIGDELQRFVRSLEK